MNFYAVLADALITLHVAYIAVVVFGQLAIVIGWPLGWSWIRNPWFRGIHLSMIAIVAFEAAVEYECPLTTWEHELRVMAGQLPANYRDVGGPAQDLSFIGGYLQSVLFYQGISHILTWCYYGFATLVLATLFLVPPRFRRQATPNVPTPPEPPTSSTVSAKCS